MLSPSHFETNVGEIHLSKTWVYICHSQLHYGKKPALKAEYTNSILPLKNGLVYSVSLSVN